MFMSNTFFIHTIMVNALKSDRGVVIDYM